MDYKASKAWHMGHELAGEIQQLVERIPTNPDFDIADRMRHLAILTPERIADSIGLGLRHEKIKAYRVARAACTELQEHLSLARDLHYIDDRLYQQLAAKAIAIYRLLSALIQSGKPLTEEN